MVQIYFYVVVLLKICTSFLFFKLLDFNSKFCIETYIIRDTTLNDLSRNDVAST